jgi:hypothetical protein
VPVLDGFGFVKGTGFNLYNVFIERRQHVSATTFYRGKETASDKPQSDQFPKGKKIMVFKPIWDKSLDGLGGLT